MTRENAKKLLPIIEAFANGAYIEFKQNYELESAWTLHKGSDFAFFDDMDYRIAPEPEYVPFNYTDALDIIGKHVKEKLTGHLFTILGVEEKGVYLFGDSTKTFEYAFDRLTFIDGSIFGKLKS